LSFLLDTNVVSEWVKLRPDPGVVMWLADADEDGVFISVVTLAELRHGIQRMPNGARRSRLNTWLAEELPARFEARMLTIDTRTAGVTSWQSAILGGGPSARWTPFWRRPRCRAI
jgi:predicted nucleic acid-binding protein